MLKEVLKQYPLLQHDLEVQPFGNGLINHTWRVSSGDHQYILQKINTDVFKDPVAIDENIRMIGSYLSENHPDYLFVRPVNDRNGKSLIKQEASYFRLFPFVSNSHVFDKLEDSQLAYEAAQQFARFTRLLSGFDASQLNITIPQFHDLSFRFQQFEAAREFAEPGRIEKASALVKRFDRHEGILSEYNNFINSNDKKLRVMHHDTKISNVLFDANNKGICVIDLDTVMPGYFNSDVGDMMRTYLCPVSEEEKDFNKIFVRPEYFKAIVNGYLSEMGPELTAFEKSQFLFAGKSMIYMQALRFMADFLAGDKYYPVRYENNNLVRAENQLCLLEKLIAMPL